MNLSSGTPSHPKRHTSVKRKDCTSLGCSLLQFTGDFCTRRSVRSPSCAASWQPTAASLWLSSKCAAQPVNRTTKPKVRMEISHGCTSATVSQVKDHPVPKCSHCCIPDPLQYSPLLRKLICFRFDTLGRGPFLTHEKVLPRGQPPCRPHLGSYLLFLPEFCS